MFARIEEDFIDNSIDGLRNYLSAVNIISLPALDLPMFSHQ